MSRRVVLRWLQVSFIAAAAVLTLVSAPSAQTKEVVIGVLYPMTGPVAQIGIDAVNVIKVALDIINNDMNVNLPLGKGEGLPRLGGAKGRIVAVDTPGGSDIRPAGWEGL